MSNPPVPLETISDTFKPPVIMLVYGSAGTGKTHFGGTIGENGIFLSLGEGDMTLSNPTFTKAYPMKPKIARIRESYDPKTGLFNKAEAMDLVSDFMDWFVTSPHDTLTIDDATFLSIFARNKAVEFNATRQRSGVTSLALSKSSGFLNADIADYGKEMGILDWMCITQIPLFRKHTKNLILLAHERHNYKKGDKLGDAPALVKITPAFTGEKFPDHMQIYFDFIWRMECINGTVFRAHLMGSEVFAAKSRWPIPDVKGTTWTNPSFVELLNRLEEKRNA